MDQAEPVLVAQGHDQLGQVLVGDAALAAGGSACRWPTAAAGSGRSPRSPCASSWRPNSVPLTASGVALEPFVGAEARPGGPAQLAADAFSSCDDHAPRPSAPGRGGCSRWRGMAGVSGAHSAARRIANCDSRDALPSRSIQASASLPSACAGRRSTPCGLLVGRGVGAWSSRRPAAGRDDRLGQGGIGVDGVLPDLVGVRGQVHLGVGVAVEDAGLLVVEVDDRLVVRRRPRRTLRRCRPPRRSRAAAGARARAAG